MKLSSTALLAGLLFGAGLAISQMTNPAKVVGFLDVAGAWDPTLAFVMGSALLVSTIAVGIERRRSPAERPVPGGAVARAGIDARLLSGAALFGMGWGLAGFCPGPALAALATGSGKVLLFAGSMLVGMGLFKVVSPPAPVRPDVATAGSYES